MGKKQFSLEQQKLIPDHFLNHEAHFITHMCSYAKTSNVECTDSIQKKGTELGSNIK